MLHFRITFLSSIVLVLAACSPTPAPDAGTPDTGVTDMGVAPDVSPADVRDVQLPDTGPPHVAQLFGDCQRDSDCVADDMCLLNTTGYPGGFCTHRAVCRSSNDCNTDANPLGFNGICRLVGTQMLCQRACLNGFDCGRAGYTCIKAANAMSGYCTPSCDVDNCGPGAVCNLWTSLCQAPPVPTTGSDDGLACTMRGAMSECRSTNCILANNMGTFSGWNNGNCVSNCVLPAGWNPGSLWPTEVFPRGNCPTGNICFPNGGGLAEQDPGICLHECRADADCRTSEGYGCKKTFNRGRTPHTWMNGYCAPIDCLATGVTCPSNYMCETQYRVGGACSGGACPAGQMCFGGTCRTAFGVCRPSVPDAGVVDAGPADTGTADDVFSPDVGMPDMGSPDTGTSVPDVAIPDAGLDVSVD